MTEPNTWYKGQQITADRLNKTATAFKELNKKVDKLKDSLNAGVDGGASASTSTSLVMPTYSAKAPGRTRVEETNTVVYRHPAFGTKDVEEGEQGFYSNPQLVRYGADGIYEPNDNEYKKLTDSGKVYLKITTDCLGVPKSVEYTDTPRKRR